MIRRSRTWLGIGVCAALLLGACAADGDTPEEAPNGEQERVAQDAEPDVDDGDTDEVHAPETVGGFELLDWAAGDEVVASLHDGEWDGALPEVPEDDILRVGVRVTDVDGTPVEFADPDHELAVAFDDDADEIVAIEVDGDVVDLFGEVEGITRVRFQWLHEGEVRFETPSIRVIVDHFAGDYVAGREVLDPQPRLLFADAAEPRAVVYDLIVEEELASFALQQPDPIISASRFGGQVAVMSELTAGLAHVIDAGSWALGHGDHGHYYIDPPRLLGTLDLDAPSRSMHGPDRIAVSSTADGTSVVIDELRSLQGGELRSSELTVGVAGHAAGAVPLPRGFVVAPWPANGDGTAADEVALLDGGTPVSTHDCPALSALAPVPDGAVVACADRLLVGLLDEDDWQVSEIDLPGEMGDVAEIAGDVHQPFVAASDGRHLLLVDAGTAELVALVPLPADAASAPHIDDDGWLLVVTADGVVHQFDPATGQAIASSQATVSLDAGEASPRPAVVGGRDRAYVSSPGDGTILEFATNDDLRLARTFDVGGAPSGLAYFGAMW